jgi:hypothetical protein
MWFSTVAHAQPSIDPLELLVSTKSAYSKVDGYTATFIRSTGGKPETIYFKFKKPFQVYMKWIENPHRGREVIYVEGKNEGKVIARPEGLLGAFLRIVRLNPEETRTENGRYTIKDIGIGNLINRLVDLTLLAKANDDLEIHYHGLKDFQGRRVHEIERIFGDRPEYFGVHRALVYVDEILGLPIGVISYDVKGQILDQYIYKNLNLEAPLKDEDFSPSNPKYGFRYL